MREILIISLCALFCSTAIIMAEQKLASLKASVDFIERSAMMTFTGMSGKGALRIAIDEGSRILELYKENNTTVIP